MTASLIKLIDFKPKKKWSAEVNLAATCIDDSQMLLLPGSLFDQQHLLDSALDSVSRGDLVAGAAMLYALADRNDLLLA